jgi:hypothetical protein
MIPVPRGVRVWLATGATDMRRGMSGLAIEVQETLRWDPHEPFPYIPGNLSALTYYKVLTFLDRRTITSRTPA